MNGDKEAQHKAQQTCKGSLPARTPPGMVKKGDGVPEY